MPLEKGAVAPDFELSDQHGQSVSLTEVTAECWALVFFYPFAFSGICTQELTGLHQDLDRFDNDRVRLLAISCDPMYSLRAFADARGLDLPLLSDFWPHGQVARDYGVLDERAGMPSRGTFLIDRDRTVRWTEVRPPGEARDLGELADAVQQLVR